VALCIQLFDVLLGLQGFTTFSATALALTFVFGDSVKGVFEVRPVLGCTNQATVCIFGATSRPHSAVVTFSSQVLSHTDSLPSAYSPTPAWDRGSGHPPLQPTHGSCPTSACDVLLCSLHCSCLWSTRTMSVTHSGCHLACSIG
jgi:hypothetical protein